MPKQFLRLRGTGGDQSQKANQVTSSTEKNSTEKEVSKKDRMFPSTKISSIYLGTIVMSVVLSKGDSAEE